MDAGSITLLVALVILIAFSAFFSAAETAFSSLNQIRLKSRAEEGDASAARVLAMEKRIARMFFWYTFRRNSEYIGCFTN